MSRLQPTIRNSTNVNFGTRSTIACAFPTGTLAGDWLFIHIVHQNPSATDNTISFPGGWTQLLGAQQQIGTVANRYATVFYKQVNASDVAAGTVSATVNGSVTGSNRNRAYVLGMVNVASISGAGVDTWNVQTGSTTSVFQALFANETILQFISTTRAVGSSWNVSSASQDLSPFGSLQQDQNDTTAVLESVIFETEELVERSNTATVNFSQTDVTGNIIKVGLVGVDNLTGPQVLVPTSVTQPLRA